MSASNVKPPPLAAAGKIILSVLVIGHLWAVISRPIEFATLGPFGASPSVSLLRAPVRGYSQFAYLDHGYAFFAPDPGPSHLIQADITGPDDQQRQQRYPDLGDQWPRLLYHRHFMLAEFLNDVYHPPGDPPPGIREEPQALRGWHQSRRRYETVRDSIVGRMHARYPDSQIVINRLEHRPPGLPEFMGGMPLDDPRLYRTLPDALDVPEPLDVAEVRGALAPGQIQSLPISPEIDQEATDAAEVGR